MSMSIATMKGRLTSPEMQLHFLRWFDSAPIYSGSITANRLGWQVVRTKAKNYAISVRRAVQRDHADHALASVLDRDGIVVIPDFLNPDDFQRVRAACDEYAALTVGSRHRIRERCRNTFPQRARTERSSGRQCIGDQRRTGIGSSDDRVGRARDRSTGEGPTPGDLPVPRDRWRTR